MNTAATEPEFEQMVGPANPPVTGPPNPMLVPATTPRPSRRLAAARWAVSHRLAHRETHPWRITRNAAINALRRRPAALDREMVAALTPASPTTTIADATVASDLIAQTWSAFTRLPPHQSKALWLAVFYGYTAQDIAVTEGIALGTAKTRIRQGMRTLRGQFTPPDALGGRPPRSDPPL
jgi:DNA-directed RNA polymerase specialized sigma24 family protein